MKFYKNKYIIGIYAPIEEGETLLGICDNISEFADFLGVGYFDSAEILRLLYLGKTHGVKVYGRICSVAFIEIGEN